jgi:hypothetical protein
MLSSPSMTSSSFEIAPGVKNTDWQTLSLTPESDKRVWKKAIGMFRKRVNRFIEPVNALMSSTDTKTILFSGFATMALDCLLIEALQSFRKGRPNPVRVNDRQSTKMIVDFLTQRAQFNTYFDDEAKARLFCDHFRNGILHQGEVKSSGRIRIDTPKMIMPSGDNQSFVVNRWKFHNALVKEVENYEEELVDGKDVELRRNFIKKMNEICRL